MSNNVITLYPCGDIAESLRNIADGIEEGEFSDECCTLIIGGDVFSLGFVDNAKAAESAIFDMTLGIHKLMRAATDPENYA